MAYYLGIDGGGTRTTALLCDDKLREIARAEGGSVNYRSEGMDNARENLRALLAELKEAAGRAKL